MLTEEMRLRRVKGGRVWMRSLWVVERRILWTSLWGLGMREWWKRLIWPAALIVVIVGALPPSAMRAQRRVGPGEWRSIAADAASTRYSPLSQIKKENVRDLQVAWRRIVPDGALQASNPVWSAGRYSETPIMANGTLYSLSALGLMSALARIEAWQQRLLAGSPRLGAQRHLMGALRTLPLKADAPLAGSTLQQLRALRGG